MTPREETSTAATARALIPAWRILLVEDQPLTRRGIRAILESIPDVTVVGEAATGAEAVDRAIEFGANLVLMDLNLPEMDGLEATRRLRARTNGAAIVVLTVRDDQDAIREAFRAGASGFISKSAGIGELSTMLRSLATDGVYLRPPDTSKLLSVISARPEAPPFQLTTREQQVLELLALGLSARGMGANLGIGERTVNTYVANLYRKMGVNNRVSAVREGFRLHLIAPPA
ncbi:MAG: response regulator [Actinomycetota bacterium]